MAALLYKQGKLQEAEPLYRRALEINEVIYGADARATLVSQSVGHARAWLKSVNGMLCRTKTFSGICLLRCCLACF